MPASDDPWAENLATAIWLLLEAPEQTQRYRDARAHAKRVFEAYVVSEPGCMPDIVDTEAVPKEET